MSILNRYIGQHIINATLIVSAAIMGVLVFTSLIFELQDLGNGDYGIWQVLSYVPLTLPAELYQIFPMIGLIGGLFGLGMLASRSELIVMRSVGKSTAQITWAVMRATLLLVFIVSMIGETLAPNMARYAESRKATQLSSGQALSTLHGVWVRFGNTFIHINEVMPDDELQGITQYHFSNSGELEVADFSERASLVDDQWYLFNVKQSHITDEQVSAQHYDSLMWDVEINREVLTIAKMNVQSLSLFKMYSYIQYLRANGLDSIQFEFNFWQRLFQPLATAVMMLLAVPFIFGPLRSATMGFRMVSGLTLGLGFYLLNELIGPFSLVYQVPPMLAALIPVILFTIVGAWLMRRAQ